MKVCGFTIVKNAIKFDYPVVEAIKSALPLVDKFIVALGDSDDNTEELIRSINSDKIEYQHSIWPTNNKNGNFLGDETNKALDQISDEYTWCLYLQSDEVLHEEDYPVIKAAMEKYEDNLEVDGFLFNWKHFWGNYNYLAYGRKWYRRDMRIIRNNKKVRSWHDAQGFRKSDGEKPTGVPLDAFIYHYGWVRSPNLMKKKVNNSLWNKRFWGKGEVQEDEFDFGRDYDCVVPYKGHHPKVMRERMKHINWDVSINPRIKNYKLKERVLMWFERLTGHRLFENQHFHVFGKGKRSSNFWDEPIF
ncbi:hypothetical protein [Marinifilum sp.]|uniref:hypothetical protein n=1 Tax=Marinifilum sp. TaxID=2033137 RepID=UPI003BAAA4B7